MKTERIYIRITPELKARLQALAAADGRTISNYITRLIEIEVQKTSPTN